MSQMAADDILSTPGSHVIVAVWSNLQSVLFDSGSVCEVQVPI